MRTSTPSALLLIFLSTVTFYSCEKVERQTLQRVAKGDVHVGGSLRVANSKAVTNFLPSQINDAVSS